VKIEIGGQDSASSWQTVGPTQERAIGRRGVQKERSARHTRTRPSKSESIGEPIRAVNQTKSDFFTSPTFEGIHGAF
jgi:hypothetical protein